MKVSRPASYMLGTAIAPRMAVYSVGWSAYLDSWKEDSAVSA